MSTLRIAVTQYPPQQYSHWQAIEDHYHSLFKHAMRQGVNLLLLPEYVGLELVGLFPESNALQQFQAIQKILPDYLSLCQKLAKHYGIYFQPGTIPITDNEEAFYNRAYWFTPSGQYDFQDKINLTAFESGSRLIKPGNRLKIFDTPFFKIAIAICYDSEFPVLVQQFVLAGADLILVPSCTDSVAGYHRVHFSCRARAIENQCFVANACLVNEAPWSTFIDSNIGNAGIFSPIDIGFPDDGILAKGKSNSFALLIADIDKAKLVAVRKHGAVRNYRDMQANKHYSLSISTVK